MKFSAAFLAVLAITSSLAFAAAADSQVEVGTMPPTVSTLNVTQYLGLWYQMYNDGFVNTLFENHGVCVTAQYGLFPNGTVSVYNRQRMYNTSGDVESVWGYATVPDPSQPGQLQVYFPFNPIAAPYWVIELGPVIDDVYSYAIVTDPYQIGLYVLARDPLMFKAKFDTDVRAKLLAWGFDGIVNTPIPIPQDNCPPWPTNTPPPM